MSKSRATAAKGPGPNVVGQHPWASQKKIHGSQPLRAGRFDEATAYGTFDRHTFGDLKTLRTSRLQTTGKDVDPLFPLAESGVRRICACDQEDTVNPNLLFLSGPNSASGFSVDGGQHWAQYKRLGISRGCAARHRGTSARGADPWCSRHTDAVIWIVERHFGPCRALHPELMGEKKRTSDSGAALAIQYFDVNGGWPEGDESFSGGRKSTLGSSDPP